MRTILTNLGKANLLQQWMANDIFLGVGSGSANWFTSRTASLTFADDNTLNVGFGYVDTVVVKSADDATTYSLTSDYTVNLTTGVITRAGSGSIAHGATVHVSFNVNAPPSSPADTALVTPIGYKKITAKSFAELDDAGTVVVDTGTFNLVFTPTPNLYLSSVLGAGEFAGSTIREVGFFVGLTRATGVAGTVNLLLPNQVASPGVMLAIKRRTAQIHDGITEHAYQRVLSL